MKLVYNLIQNCSRIAFFFSQQVYLFVWLEVNKLILNVVSKSKEPNKHKSFGKEGQSGTLSELEADVREGDPW